MTTFLRRRLAAIAVSTVLLLTGACGDANSDEDDTSAASNPPATAEAAVSASTHEPAAGPDDSPTATPEPIPQPTATPPEPTRVPTATPDPLAARDYPETTGTGVTVVIIDRGIDYDHPDFLNPDGTTRIKAILDMTGQSYCAGNRDVVEFSEDQINQALKSGEPLGTDDYQGHGTATAGAAAGNGLALDGAPLRGPASTADLVIVKATSEGATASAYGPGESRVDGCGTDALRWVDRKITELGQPAVALWNAGVQWGPIDGTSQLSREIEAVFGPDRPGRVWVVSSGDEGSLANHASGTYQPGEPIEIPFSRETDRVTYPTAWLSAPASITIESDDGVVIGPVTPGNNIEQDGVTIRYTAPGAEFYPWTSTSGDYAIWMSISSGISAGVIRFESLGGTGIVDLYGDVQGAEFLSTSITFDDYLVPGRLTDFAATEGAVVVGVHVERSVFDSETGSYDLSAEGEVGDLWLKSSGGPTRDGRDVLDVTAAGQNAPAALGQASSWAASRGNVLQGSDGFYVRFGGTSGAGPIVVGTVALMLEANPELTAAEVKQILRDTAIADEFTGEVPNDDWGYGKLDIFAAVAMAEASSE